MKKDPVVDKILSELIKNDAESKEAQQEAKDLQEQVDAVSEQLNELMAQLDQAQDRCQAKLSRNVILTGLLLATSGVDTHQTRTHIIVIKRSCLFSPTADVIAR